MLNLIRLIPQVVEDPSQQGLMAHWQSDILETQPFKRLVVSWNTQTFLDTSVEIWIRVRHNNQWSMWFSYGKWTTDGQNTGSFSGQKDGIARLDIDELVVLNQGAADALQLKAELNRKHISAPMPLLKRLYVSLDAGGDAGGGEAGGGEAGGGEANLIGGTPSLPAARPISVRPRAQLSIEDIGNRICSPTSVAMVLDYYGQSLTTEAVARGTRDNGTSIYGNWSYNVAFAAEQNFDAYAHYCRDFKHVAHWLAQGKPIIASVTLKNAQDLIGAFQAYPSGHLMVLTGIDHHQGQTYVLANDPAAYSEDQVPRRYRLDQFLKAYKNLVYMIEPEGNLP